MGKYLIKIPLNKVLNPIWKNYEWNDIEMGISKPLPLSPIPVISGNAISSIITEAT
jgi:filamentous hemagglutinin